MLSVQISPRVKSRIAFIFAMFLPFGKAGGLQILRCKGFAVDDYGFTLCALALKPSDFCNIEVKRMAWIHIPGIEGKVYQPETDPAAPRKHDCADCFSCQMCGDSRCEKCRGHGTEGIPPVSPTPSE